MIVSFGDGATDDFYNGRPTRRARGFPQDIVAVALRKLDMVSAARQLRDLQAPPGNRLERLSGGLKGFHGIRVNDQWRIVFRWVGSDAHDVRITDYH